MLGLFKGFSEQGLIAHWQLDETSGLVANERKGRLNGTLTNMVGDEWTTGKIGGGLEFDGVDEFVDLDAHASNFPLGASPRTIAFWDNRTSGELAFGYGGTSGSGARFNCGASDGRALVEFNGHLFGVEGLGLSGFNHFAYVVPVGATQTDDILIFVNGVSQTLATISGAVRTLNTTSGDASIGANNIRTGFFGGVVDDLRIYDRALSAAEIAGLAGLGI